MKKITLWLFLGLFTFLTLNAQQGFENGVPPSGWIQFTGLNNAGQAQQWESSSEAAIGNFSAHIRFEPGVGETEDWLVTPRGNVPGGGGILTFKQKQSFVTDYGNTYSVRISTAGGVPTADEYVIVEQWTEADFSTEWTTKYVDLSAYTNQIYVAFVMTQNDGDNWFIDEANFVIDGAAPDCPLNPIPTDTATDIALFENDMILSWDASLGEPAESYEVFIGTTSGVLSSIGTVFGTSIEATSLDFATTYYWQVIPSNYAGASSGCSEFSFTTKALPTGSICNDPIIINTLPYNTSDNTGNYTNSYIASTCDANYISGYETIYTYTPTVDTSIDVILSGISENYTAVHVLDGCPDIAPNCIMFQGNGTNTDDINLLNFEVDLGNTYYIVVSSQINQFIESTSYTLDIIENSCISPLVDFTVVQDCDNSGGFFVDVNITDLGSATNLTVADNQGNSNGSVSATGVVQFGPYINGTDVTATVTNNQDGTCVVVGNSLTQLTCPPPNDLCADATEIIPSTTGAEVWHLGSTIGTTSSAEVTSSEISCVGGFPFDVGNDVWFKTRVPAAGEITITTRAASGSLLTDTFITIFDGNCGLLNEVGCNLDGGFGITPFSEVILGVGDVAVDDILYIRVSRTFDVGFDDEFEIATHAVDAVLNTEVETLSDIVMYPNPANDVLNFKSDKTIESIQIFNLIGQEIKFELINQRNPSFSISELNSGVYIVKAKSEENISSFRLIKK